MAETKYGKYRRRVAAPARRSDRGARCRTTRANVAGYKSTVAGLTSAASTRRSITMRRVGSVLILSRPWSRSGHREDTGLFRVNSFAALKRLALLWTYTR